MIKLRYAGFDTLDIAFMGALPEAILEDLQEARDQAEKQEEPVLIEFGPGKVKAHISGNGKPGGYRFILDTGPLGAIWMIKRNSAENQWNFFVSPRSTMLLAYGYRETFEQLLETIKAMGGRVITHSINRADFAMDFETNGFELHPEQIVAHSHSKVSPRYSKRASKEDDNQPHMVLRGRRVESITIGKQPGRQIIIYDKRREAIERQKYHWFKVWGKDRHDPNLEIWRIEVRGGKKELKDNYRITTLYDFEASIGDVIINALHSIRHLASGQVDSNVSRQALSPLWQAAQSVAASDLRTLRSGLTPGQVREVEREKAIETYTALCMGNAIGLCVAEGISDDDIRERLPRELKDQLQQRIHALGDDLNKSIRRTRDRLAFVDSKYQKA